VTDQYNPQKMKVKIYYDVANKTLERNPDIKGQIWDSTRVVILFGAYMNGSELEYHSSWEVRFNKDIHDSLLAVVPPESGDIFRFRTTRNPNRNDVYRFKVEGGKFDQKLAGDRMRDIYVVPDPYVASSSFESMYYLGGRASRKVEFVNLPPKCTIKIFTASGKLIKTLAHDSPVDYGRHAWDLTTEDGPEIAFGMYFFYVESPGIGTTKGKFAVIK
jgi:hypothetical protein